MPRILVVDDEHLIADTLSLIFRMHGFDTLATYSGEEAVSRAAEFRPDLLLCDINLPGLSGFELIDIFSRDRPACRLLVLTGQQSNLPRVTEQVAALPGAAGVFTKPCNPADLVREAGALLATA